MHRYRSSRYPGISAAALAGLSIGRPLALCMLPLMTVSVAVMLGGRDPLPLLLWATPLAVATAWFWTWQQLRATIVEVLVDGSAVSVRSAWDVASGRPPGPREAVLDVRRDREHIVLTLGLEPCRLAVHDFADAASLFDRLEEAARMHVSDVRSRLDTAPRGGSDRP